MIPKIIHYCWFGRGEKPGLTEKCMKSWSRFCPDYEIVEWNEDNFDVNGNRYVRQAYENRKYAFVTDYVRLYALYTYGGVYLDTDVEIIRPIDQFLKEKAFSGFETPESIPTGIMASEKGVAVFKELLNWYDDKEFVDPKGNFNLTTNVQYITSILLDKGLILGNCYQTVAEISMYPSEYFCPKDYLTGKICLTENTYTIHHFAGSWQTDSQKLVFRLKYTVQKMLGEFLTKKIVEIKKRIRHRKTDK